MTDETAAAPWFRRRPWNIIIVATLAGLLCSPLAFCVFAMGRAAIEVGQASG